MASGTLVVTPTETDVSLVGFDPNAQVSFEIHYHVEPGPANYMGISGYTNVDDTGSLDLVIPFGSQLVEQITRSTYTFADGPFFTGSGVFLATH